MTRNAASRAGAAGECALATELRELLGLPEDREGFTGLSLGWPRYKFKHTIRRPLAEVKYL